MFAVAWELLVVVTFREHHSRPPESHPAEFVLPVSLLDDFGLAAAISLEVERLREAGYQLEYEEGLADQRLPAMAENALFRIVEEALTNIKKHAQSRKVRVEARCGEGEVYLEVGDYGRGFDLEVTSAASGLGKTVGLARMREWAMLLGGELVIHTEPGAAPARD